MNSPRLKAAIPEKPSELKKWLSVALLVAIIIGAGRFTRFSLKELVLGLSEGGGLLREMFWPPDFSYMQRLLAPLVETLQIAVVGTILGSLLSIPIAIFSARNFLKNPPLTGAFRVGLSLLRTIPALVFAALFVSIFGYGSFGGMLALLAFSIGLVAKLTYESMESIDPGPVEALEASGASKLSVLRYAIVPQVLPQFMSYVLYAFEINVRAAAVLGYVGAGGIADYYNRTLSFLRYAQTGAIVVLTFFVVLAIDLLSAKIRERLV